MKRSIIVLILIAAGLFSCKHGSKSTTNTGEIKTLDSAQNVQSQKPLTILNEKYIHTEYKYADSTGAQVIIQNSLPKSGITYTDPNGEKYVYAVFWTRITNETVNPFKLAINFPIDAFAFPTSSKNYIKLLIPLEPMTADKESLFDYGLEIKSFLDNYNSKSSSLQKTIEPKSSSAFYVVIQSDHGVNGTLRTGLSLKGHNLFYKINGKEISCGKINLKNLILQN